MAIASDTRTVVGVFNSVSDAQSAVRELESAGIARDHISLVANKNAVGYDTMDASDRDKASDVVADAGIGAALGGVGGLLLSAAGAITIPVIGPILAAGPIAAALTGAGIGAATGGLIGALTESGVPEEHAKYYAEGVRRGDVLVTVRADSEMADRVSDILDRNHAVNVDDRVTDWKTRGWSGYSTDATPYSDDELRRERDYYRTNRGTLTGHTGIDVDRERSTIGTRGGRGDREFDSSRGNMGSTTSSTTGGTVGTTGMTSLGLGNAGSTAADRVGDDIRNAGYDATHTAHRAGERVSNEVRDAGRTASNAARRTEDRVSNATSITNPGHPNQGSAGDRTRDALGEAGRDAKEFGRDVNDALHGRTGKQPHDYAEEMREAERDRRRNSRIY